MISNAELDRLIAELRTHPLAEAELREVKEGLYVSLSQSQPEGLHYAFCLSWDGRAYFYFRKTVGLLIHSLRIDRLLASALSRQCLSILCRYEADVSTRQLQEIH